MKLNFQLILIIVFIVAAIVGILVFSGAIPIGSDQEGSMGTVTIWGITSSRAVVAPLEEFNKNNPAFTVKYVQKSEDTFDQDLLEALATGTGPDLFFLPDDLAYQYADKIFTIPYSSYPLSTFKNNFAGAGEVFLTSKGILALPMTVDPLVMYYNRSLLDASGIVYPPATWEELAGMVPKLTKKDDTNKISQSTVALGHASNVNHFKDILGTLFMQAGNPIVSESGDKYISQLFSSVGTYDVSSMLKFYTDFADPNHPAYSWNKSFSNSDEVFSREELVFYFGFASELEEFVNRNPNQNFFVAPLPQIKDAKSKAVMGRVTGLAISKSSRNFTAAYAAATQMATSGFANSFAGAQNLPPARRDLLALKTEDAFSPIFYSSALFARSWPDPSPRETDTIFASMINSVLSNSLSVEDAIKDGGSKLSLLLLK